MQNAPMGRTVQDVKESVTAQMVLQHVNPLLVDVQVNAQVDGLATTVKVIIEVNEYQKIISAHYFEQNPSVLYQADSDVQDA